MEKADRAPDAPDTAYPAKDDAQKTHHLPHPHQSTSPQILVASLELLKFVNWFTELFKVTANRTGAQDYYGWAWFNLVMATLLLLQRAFDQVVLVARSQNWSQNSKCYLTCLTWPVSMWLVPLGTLTVKSRRQTPEDLVIFAKRPITTILLGLPFGGVMAHCVADPVVVMHPVMVFMRALHSLYQVILQDVPDFIIDLLVIVNCPEGQDVSWFVISFIFSVINLLSVCFTTVREINEHDSKKHAHHVANNCGPGGPGSPTAGQTVQSPDNRA